MTIAQLREVLKAIPAEFDSAKILRTSADHAFSPAVARLADAERTRTGQFYDYFDDENMGAGSTRVKVLLVD